MKQRRKKNLKPLIIAFAAMAVAAPTAQAKPVPSPETTRAAGTTTSSASYHVRWAQEARSALNKVSSQSYSPQALKALSLRSEAMNARYQSQSQSYSPQALKALTLRSEGMNVRYQQPVTRPDDRTGVRGPGVGKIGTPQLVSVNSNQFDWTDAGIGAGTAFGASIVLIGALMASRRRHQGELAV